jgi:hypothetical protein
MVEKRKKNKRNETYNNRPERNLNQTKLRGDTTMKNMKRMIAILVLAAVATMGTPQAFAGIMLGDAAGTGTCRDGIMLGDFAGIVLTDYAGIMLGD